MAPSFRFLIAVGAATLLAGGPTVAQTAEDRNAESLSRAFRILDTNNDGRITMDEIRAEQMRLFVAADIDGDGQLSVEEFRRRGRWFQQLYTTTLFDLFDADGDGVLTADEIAAASARWFKRYDKDGSGYLVPGDVPQFQQSGSHFPRKQ